MLIAIAVLLLALFARAVQVQWAQHAHWEEQAQRRLEDIGFIDTSRGRILDCKGRELALDAPCIDAVVDYRAILRPANENWITDVAKDRLRRKLGSDYTAATRPQQKELLQEQVAQVKQDLQDMWEALGDEKLTGQTHEQIEDRRQQIVRKVQMQKRYLWYSRFVRAEKKQQEQENQSPWWQRWLMDDSILDRDSFDVTVEEEIRPHVILPAVNTELANYLGKNVDRFPGLSLRPGQHRLYPYADAACHVIGNLAAVDGEDVKNDPEGANVLRKYWPYDLIGRQGAERLFEATLRGSRGRWRREPGKQAQIEDMARPGQDVQLSIDIELQKKVQAAFLQRKLPKGEISTDIVHGAAIMLDVKTGQVRAMVSYPTYDLNTIAQQYASLVRDEINTPLLNRATMSQLEPGSTVKPIVGMAGITEKVVKLHEGIECTGYLQLNGITYKNYGRCWSIRGQHGLPHHAAGSPHHGSFGNPDGFLVFADALERSCNVWPETVADRLGLNRLLRWYDLFGLGRRTGVGLPEAAGRLPDPSQNLERSATWFAGMGQGIGATPLQMANVAATIARDGTWVRPSVAAGGQQPESGGPDRVALPLDPQAVAEARRGMTNVVNGLGATGRSVQREDMKVAGKTGTAQAVRFSVLVRDEKGNVVMEDGKPKRRDLEPSTTTWSNPEAPWYRGSGTNDADLAHAWFIGFAPADRPQVAFAVMVEYGGSGGGVAGPIATALLDAAIEEGYLASTRSQP